ncbi:MAG: hypothetical protein COB16_11895 [Rhodobacteraceae bacterium]|nr:MAG: hypothetical protein COB16_11895 [Paracoccaceae bacterium]
MTTKKALVPVVNGKITKGRAFALPVFRPEPCLVAVPKGDVCHIAALVYTGREITPKDILEKLTTNGVVVGIEQEPYLDFARHYLDCVKQFKVGDFVQLDEAQESFSLKKVDKKLSSWPLGN